MANEVDISETSLLLQYPGVLEKLLLDHTTGHNIFWATDSYTERGEGYTFFDEITIDRVTGENGMVVRPRSVKSREEQTQRAKDKAEVFTPSWICNAQNNLVDEAWFGRKGVFNTEVIDSDGNHSWVDTEGPIEFSTEKGKKWKDYVHDQRLEITCGEAPYLVNRYDTVTGEPIADVRHRIGLLDRKLRVVSENVQTSGDWIRWAKIALTSIYGYEWQGDNLLLAREAVFFTILDHYKFKFGKDIARSSLIGIAYIVSWNLWQMDGIRMVIPRSCENQYETDMFGERTPCECSACKNGKISGHLGVKCLIRDWTMKKPANWKPKPDEDEKSRPWQKIMFVNLFGEQKNSKSSDSEDDDFEDIDDL